MLTAGLGMQYFVQLVVGSDGVRGEGQAETLGGGVRPKVIESARYQ